MVVVKHVFVDRKRVEGLGAYFIQDLERFRGLLARTYQVETDKVRFIYEEVQ